MDLTVEEIEKIIHDSIMEKSYSFNLNHEDKVYYICNRFYAHIDGEYYTIIDNEVVLEKL